MFLNRMHVPSLIEKKRDGGQLSADEISYIIANFTRGEIPDYQVSALAMAIFFRGMTDAETWDLTKAMLESGHRFTYPPNSPPKVDKHSTGAIGGKTSLVLAPLLACDELWVPMISGRGLDITGGTLDKLECIPGFDVNLGQARALEQLKRIGVFMIGQTAEICPADKKLYALRDVTGTVPSRALIVASIMSKKLAESLDRLVLNVRFGSGAFMKERREAELLGDAMLRVGEAVGLQISYLLTPMNEPLGRTVGNALELAEAIDVLRGAGPPDVVNLVLDLAIRVANTSRAQLQRWLQDGTAWKKFVAMVEAQDGDASALEKMTQIHRAPVIREIKAERTGRIVRMDAQRIGRASLMLGGGRQIADDAIDFAVGVSDLKKIGESVESGDALMRVHARAEKSCERGLLMLKQAVAIE
jgi:pyrimidine-nucleoside phosphorylase